MTLLDPVEEDGSEWKVERDQFAGSLLVKQCDTREAAAPKDPDMHTGNDRQSLPDRGERVALADTFSSTAHGATYFEKLVSTCSVCLIHSAGCALLAVATVATVATVASGEWRRLLVAAVSHAQFSYASVDVLASAPSGERPWHRRRSGRASRRCACAGAP